MHARYAAAGKTVERIDPGVQFVWGSDAPDPRIPQGEFTAEWTSQLLVRQEGKFRFYAYVQGDVSVSLDDRVVLKGSANKPGWISGDAFEPGFGEKALAVRFRKTGESARVQLFWSSDAFPLEPIPAQLLFRDGDSPKISAVERGRQQFEAHRCASCHQRDNLPSPLPAPSLAHIVGGTSFDWLARQLADPSSVSAHARMPHFGFSGDESQAIAAFLVSVAKQPSLQKPGQQAKKAAVPDDRAGQILLRSTGCLACHSVGEQGTQRTFGGHDLAHIGEKRSVDWLYTWLAKPESLNPQHRMPLFKLSSTERRQLARHLATLKTSDFRAGKPPRDAKTLTQGRQLVKAANCAACHEIPGIKADAKALANLDRPIADWSQSCLQPTPDREKNRPAYKQLDAPAIKAYLASYAGTLSPEGAFVHGERLLDRSNCLACHERGTRKDIVKVAGAMAKLDAALKGRSQGMIPPALSAIGDKLRDTALAESVSGEQQSVRLDWLSARMPRFRHSADDKQALVDFLIGHDRIPAGAPRATQSARPTAELQPASSETLVQGHTLVGPRGLSCIACHQIGDFVPKNVALGTRGSDLLLLGTRMRSEYFMRWTSSPIRVVPGMEMPSYDKPVPNILDGRIDAQLVTIWNALNDPKFTPPTDPSAVEQYFIVRRGEPPRIVRDVFAVPKKLGGGAVPRAMAVGLNSGHSLLLDLNDFALRHWSFGDFARQRTLGKSWYWDMAGVPVSFDYTRRSDFALRLTDGTIVLPHRNNNTVGRLLSYRQIDYRVELSYIVNFKIGSQIKTIRVNESIAPIDGGDSLEGGFVRRLAVADIPSAANLLIAGLSPETPEKTARVNAEQPAQTATVSLGGKADVAAFIVKDAQGAGKIALRYTARMADADLPLQPIEVEPVVKGPITSVPGFDGVRLPLDPSIMPTAFTWLPDGTLAFASLKGHIYLARDTDGDGVEDSLTLFEEGLAAPYGIIADGNDLIVSHKPELVRLHDSNGDGRADERTVIATGWGYNDNYHDWTSGVVRDNAGNLYVGLGSDYAQKERPKEQARWRGKVLKISPDGTITPTGHALRYPTGLAVNRAGQIFVSDQQGVGNTFNEINQLIPGAHYGVNARHEENPDAPVKLPAVRIPHPMTRSINGIFIVNDALGVPEWREHGIGVEMNSRFLIRFSYEQVGDVLQGAVYYLSLPNFPNDEQNFIAPLAGAVSPTGEIYVSSIHDSGWSGGRNTGEIVRLKANGKLPNGIREIRALPDGFEVSFLKPIDAGKAARTESYSISGYTRVWQGSYATPDSGRHRVVVNSAKVAPDGKSVRLRVDQLKEGYVYDVACEPIGLAPDGKLWPNVGHYSMNAIPKR